MRLGSYLGRLIRHSIIYGAGDFLGKAVGFLLIPLYTRTLSQEEFGQLQVLFTFQAFGLMILTLGQVGTLMRYHTLAADESARRRVVGGVARIVGLGLLAAVLPVALLGPWLAERFLADRSLAPLLWILCLGMAARVCAEIPMTLLRLEERSHLYAGANVLRLLTGLGLILYLVVGLKLGLRGVILGEALGAGIFLLLLSPVLLRRTGGGARREELREYLRFGWPYMTANLGAFALISIDKLFLAAMGLIALTGIYSLGGKLGVLLNVVLLTPFTLAWGPMMYRVARDHSEDEAKRLYSRLLTYFAVLLFWAALALVLFAREIIALAAPPEYASAVRVAPILVLCTVLYGFYKNLQVGLNVTGRTGQIATSFLVAAGVNVAGNALLIPRFGMMGAAVATLVAYLVMVTSVGLASHRRYPVEYQWGRIAAAGLYAALLCLAWPLTDSLPLAPRLTIKGATVLLFPAGLLLGGYLRPAEVKQLRLLWERARSTRARAGETPLVPPEESVP